MSLFNTEANKQKVIEILKEVRINNLADIDSDEYKKTRIKNLERLENAIFYYGLSDDWFGDDDY